MTAGRVNVNVVCYCDQFVNTHQISTISLGMLVSAVEEAISQLSEHLEDDADAIRNLESIQRSAMEALAVGHDLRFPVEGV